MAGASVGILLQIMIARSFGSHILGNYYTALSLVAVLSIILTLGHPLIIAPIVARSEAEDSPQLLNNFLYVARRDIIAATILVALPVALTIWASPYFSGEQQNALLIATATAPIYAAMRLNGGLANALKLFQVSNLPELFLRPFLLLVTISICTLLARRLDTAGIVFINLIITIALTIWMAWVLSRNTKAELYILRDSREISPKIISQWRKLAAPMIIAALFVNFFADLDILIVGTILPAEEAGIFGVCIKIASLFAFAIQIVHQVLLRNASDAHLSNDRVALQDAIKSANIFAISASLIGLLLILVFGRFVLGVFGSEFIQGYFCLVWLMVAQLIRAAAGPAIQILMISGNQRAGVPVYAISTALLIICNILFVPIFNFNGAAAAVVTTTIFWTISLNWVVQKKLGISVSALHVKKNSSKQA